MAIKYNPSTANQKSTEEHGAYYLADNPNLYEIQRSNNYELIITDIDNIVKAGYLGTESNAKIANAQEVLRLSCKNCPVPHFSQNVIEVKRGNTTLRYAGTPNYETGSIQFYDYIGAQTKDVLMAWQNLSYNYRTEKVGLVQDYKKDCYLIEYSPDYQVVRKWVLKGCWINSISEDAFESDSNNAHLVSGSITYDYSYIDTSEDI